MRKIGSSSDVLTDIIRKLSLQEQFVCISVTHQFQFAAIQALKQRTVLIVNRKQYGWDGTGRRYTFQGSNVVNCGCGRHKLKKKDLIDSVSFNKPNTIGNILAYLPGINVAHFGSYIKGIYKDLSEYCPNISCLVIKGHSEELTSHPAVTHFAGSLNTAVICKLPQIFPKLTSLCLYGVSEGNFNEKSFREGITRLKLIEMSDHWQTIFKSPAMKTLQELDIYVWHIHSYDGSHFVAPKLISIDWKTWNYEEQMTFILKSLCSSPLLQKLVLQDYSIRPQEVSASLFTAFNHLKVMQLPLVVGINRILLIVCRNNPLLEDVVVYGIGGDDGYVALQKFSRLRNLKSLEIVNQHIGKISKDEGISQEQLLKFVAENQQEEELRFLFTLHQRKDFPGKTEKMATEMDWNAIKWKWCEH